MTDLLDAINPWHLLFDLLGWCVVAAVIILMLALFFAWLAATIDGLIRKGRGK